MYASTIGQQDHPSSITNSGSTIKPTVFRQLDAFHPHGGPYLCFLSNALLFPISLCSFVSRSITPHDVSTIYLQPFEHIAVCAFQLTPLGLHVCIYHNLDVREHRISEQCFLDYSSVRREYTYLRQHGLKTLQSMHSNAPDPINHDWRSRLKNVGLSQAAPFQSDTFSASDHRHQWLYNVEPASSRRQPVTCLCIASRTETSILPSWTTFEAWLSTILLDTTSLFSAAGESLTRELVCAAQQRYPAHLR